MQQGRVSEIPQDRYALIIGAMKCATTSLFSYLAEHPAVAPAKIKEPEFFSRNQGHRAQVARYQDLWDFDPDLHRYAMEASTGYTKWGERGAAERIHAYGLRPKLVYVVRDPFARIESHYNFMLQNPAWTRGITDENLVQTSNYYLYVADYARVFGRENLMILDYEALSADPRGTVNRACGFLGLAPVAVDRRPLGPQRHRAAEVLFRAPAAPAGSRRPRPRRPGGAEAPGPPCARRAPPRQVAPDPGAAPRDRRDPRPRHGPAPGRIRRRRRAMGVLTPLARVVAPRRRRAGSVFGRRSITFLASRSAPLRLT